LANKFATDEIWCSPYEHDSVFNVSNSILTKDNLEIFNRYEVSLFCQQLVNPITGDVFDIQKIFNEYIGYQENKFYGVDATAAIGHIHLPKAMDSYCDAIWFSGHKFYTEKNIACMWISNRLARYLMLNKEKNNQYGLVHGTLDISGIKMLSEALSWANNNILDSIYIQYTTKCLTKLTNLQFLSFRPYTIDRTRAINALYLPNINADALQTYLASKDIYVGVGHSACSGNADFSVLKAMGFDETIARQTIRVSFGVDNVINDVDILVKEIKNFMEMF